MRSFAARALPDARDAEDAAEAALLKAFDRAADYDEARDALTWVLALCAYECKTLRKRAARRREETGVAAEALALSATTPEDLLIARDLEAHAKELVGSLSLADAEVLRAAIAGEPSGGATMRKRLSRALSQAQDPSGGRNMESTDAPRLARVARTYELGRMRRAIFYALLAVPMVVVSEQCCCCGRGVSVAGGALLAAVLWVLTSRGGHLGRRVLPVSSPARFPSPRRRWRARAGRRRVLPACIAGGMLGGVVIAGWARRSKEGRAPFIFGAGAVAAATGSLGCAMAGSTGVVAMIAALAAVSAPVAVKAALAR